MSNSLLFRAVLALLFLLYPVLVYLGLREFQPRSLALVLLVLVAIRFLFHRTAPSMAVAWVGAAGLVVLLTHVTGTSFGLLLYPFMINLILLVVFAFSLVNPPTVVERIARATEPDLPVHAVAYTRKVTWAWCFFFCVNGAISLATVYGSSQWWALYNGLISYLLMGLLMAAEYIVRRRVKRTFRG